MRRLYTQDYFARAKAFAEGFATQLRPAIDARLATYERRLYERAADAEDRAQMRFAVGSLDATIETAILPATTEAARLPADDPDKPARLAEAVAQATALIDGNPALKPLEKASRKAATVRALQSAFARGLSHQEKAGLDPDAAIETIGGRIRRLAGNSAEAAEDDADEPVPLSAPAGPDGFGRAAWLALVSRHHPELARGKSNAEILALRSDPELSAELRERAIDGNARSLRARGHEATPGNLYLAHLIGPDGAASLLGAEPRQPAADVDPAGARERPEVFFVGGDPAKPRTVGEVLAAADEAMAGARRIDWRQQLNALPEQTTLAFAKDAAEAAAWQAAETALAEQTAYDAQISETEAAIEAGGFGFADLEEAHDGGDGWLKDPNDYARLRALIDARAAEAVALWDTDIAPVSPHGRTGDLSEYLIRVGSKRDRKGYAPPVVPPRSPDVEAVNPGLFDPKSDSGLPLGGPGFLPGLIPEGGGTAQPSVSSDPSDPDRRLSEKEIAERYTPALEKMRRIDSNDVALRNPATAPTEKQLRQLEARRKRAEYALATSRSPKTLFDLRWHHPWPKYLGGARSQLLDPLPRYLHDAFHALLDKRSARKRGTAYYNSLPAEERAAFRSTVDEVILEFDAQYGTEIYRSWVANGFAE